MKDYSEPSDSEEEVFGKLSKINSAGLVNSALHNLWLDFFRYLCSGKYLSANNSLDCIWTILGGEKGIEGEDSETKFIDLEKELAKIGDLQNSIQIKGFGKIDTKQIENMSKHKALLMKKSIFLRRLQNSQGKGTAYHDEDEGDFD